MAELNQFDGLHAPEEWVDGLHITSVDKGTGRIGFTFVRDDGGERRIAMSFETASKLLAALEKHRAQASVA